MKDDFIEKKVDEADAEVMDWFYECCSINFGAEGMVQDSTELREILQRILQEALLKGSEDTAKAFGGCTSCYGKGYSTVRNTAGTSRGTWLLDPYIPCPKCERGKQIEEMKAALKKEVMEGTK